MRSYSVEVAREGKWWMVSVPEIDGLTQARRLSEVEAMARSLVALTLTVDPASFTLDVRFVPLASGVDVDKLIGDVASSRDGLDAAQAAYSQTVRSAVMDLVALGLPLRDVGVLLGMSFQRVQQLARESA